MSKRPRHGDSIVEVNGARGSSQVANERYAQVL